jgi:hypothetical protein
LVVMNGFVEAMAMASVPFIQFGKGKAIVRQFQNDVDEKELVWQLVSGANEVRRSR